MSRKNIKNIIVTNEMLEKAGEYALLGAQNNTIEGMMDWPVAFILKHKEVAKFLLKKRQERKIRLLEQNMRIIESNQLGAAASTLIFTEKQSEHMGGLGFSDNYEDQKRLDRPLVVIIGGNQDQIKQIESTVKDVKPGELEE